MTELWESLLCVMWVFAPAGVANMAPVFASHISWLRRFDTPIDGGKSFRGQRIFGNHKTWRGLISGIVLATAAFAVQQVVVEHNDWFARITDMAVISGGDYVALPALMVGPLFALGALGGDALKSFLKRRIGVAPGKKWFPFDQLDFIIGGAFAITPFIRFSLLQYACLLVAWLILDMVVTYIGWLLKLKDAPL